MNRLHNFSAGPGALPVSVLEEARDEMLVFGAAGASIMEISHRSPEFTAVLESAKQHLRDLMGLTDEWHVLFLQGGASMQFYQSALNFLGDGQTADYINTGAWASKAIKEAKRCGNVNVAASSEEDAFSYIPPVDTWKLSDNPAYVHFTSNNTIFGTEFRTDPDVHAPLVCDASSDFLSRPIDLSGYGMLYAGAQKNIGPAGGYSRSHPGQLPAKGRKGIPTMLDYSIHASKLFNTPPVFAIYMVEKVLRWLKDLGGLGPMQRRNETKASMLYSQIDASGFYSGTVQPESRSYMNVTFRLPSEELDAKFVSEAKTHGLVALKGYRTVGGIRASIYNACEPESVRALVDFMAEFERVNG